MKKHGFTIILRYTEVCSNDADRLTYSKDPDQTVHGLLFLIRAANTNTLDDYGKCQWPDVQWNFYLYFSTIEFMTK